MHARSLFVLLLLTLPPHAIAQERTDPREVPLRSFTTAEIARIEPLLAAGIVGLVELPQGELVPAVHLAAIVEAPAETLRDLIAHPENYPRFMPAVTEVTMRDRHANVSGFTWRWRTSIFTLGGDAMMTLYSPPPSQRVRGYRIVVERTGGDLGRGREMWRILPRGRSRSLVLISARLDLRDANYITRQLASASRSLSRSITTAMAFGMLSRARLEAERRVGFVRPSNTAPLHRPTIDPVAVAPLLVRGDLLLVELDGTVLRQVAVLARYEQPEANVRRIMLDPVAFAEALITGSRARVQVRSDDGVRFAWAVDLPLIGTGGEMQLTESNDHVILLDATSGAMQGGHWRFVTQALGSAETAVLGWAHFDVGDTNFLLRAIVEADGSFRPGLSAATEIMMARALRIRLARPL